MKILIFNWRDIKSPDFGGAEVTTYELARRWVKWGHQVTWFSSKFKNCKEKETVEGIKIIRQGSLFTVHLKAFFFYKKHFKSKFDIIIDQVHGIPFFTPLYVKEPKIAYIHEVAGKIWFWEWPLSIALLGFLSDFIIFRLFYRKTKFITISQTTAMDLESVGISKENIRIIKNGVAKIKISQNINKEKFPTLIFLGRLYRAKRAEEILKATKLLVKKYPKLRLWIVGKGKNNYTKKLKKLAESLKIDQNVTFYGFLEEKKKNELLKRAWVLVMTSLKEGWGLTVLEAAFLSTPSVVYNSSGLNESVIDGKTGLICKKNTPQDLAKIIGKIIIDKKLRNTLGKNAQKFARQFSWNESAKEFMKLINSPSLSKENIKTKLLSHFWNDKNYLQISRQASLNTNNTNWMKILKKTAKNSNKILDVGCGDGTRLNQLKANNQLYGLELSKAALNLGQKKYPKVNFVNADGEKMPFASSSFDFVFTAYTLEHYTTPEKIISEMIRVTKKNGKLAFVAPNYGSPIIPSPIKSEKVITKLLRILPQEIKLFLRFNNQSLNWKAVQPKISKQIEPDDDTVHLPYLPSLTSFLKKQGLEINYVSSGWEDVSKNYTSKVKKYIFLILKNSKLLNLYPLKYWGPTLFLICIKK